MKVSIIGMGAVGTAIAGALMAMSGIGEVVAVNRTRVKADGEVGDLLDTAAFGARPRLTAGDLRDLAGSDIVVITVDARVPDISRREDLIGPNHAIIRALAPDIERYAHDAIVLVVTNPVDVMAQLILRHTSLAPTRVISLGTVVDTARLMRIVGDRLQIDPRTVAGYVLGDHSETAFIPWSLCHVCGMEIDTFCRTNALPAIDRAQVRTQVIDAGHIIMRQKGNTVHGTGAGVIRLIRAIIADERSVFPVGTLLEGQYGVQGVVMSVPCVIGRHGVERVVHCALTAQELQELGASERHMRRLVGGAL